MTKKRNKNYFLKWIQKSIPFFIIVFFQFFCFIFFIYNHALHSPSHQTSLEESMQTIPLTHFKTIHYASSISYIQGLIHLYDIASLPLPTLKELNLDDASLVLKKDMKGNWIEIK